MKNNLLKIIFVLLFTCSTFAQQLRHKIGTNSTIMVPSAVLEVESTNKGVLIPRVSLINRQDNITIVSPEISLLVYNTATSGIFPNNVIPGFYYWDGVNWIRFSTYTSISALNCSSATHNGILTQGIASSGVSTTISYSGGDSSSYNSQSVTSSGVTGLTATLNSGTLASGEGTLTYNITGTPSTNGTASFTITLGGKSCLISRMVNSGTLSSLDCAGATHNGILTCDTTASGVSSFIAYSGGNGGTYAAQTIASTGVTGLTATLNSGTLSSGSGTLMYTITGTPSGAGTASFVISIGGQSCTITRTVTLPAAVVTTLDCAGATHNGTLTSGVAASGVSSVITYTGGNGGTHASQTIASTGVTGLTANLNSNTLVSGSGTLMYTITGTPSGAGTASFVISIGGQSCTLTRTVAPPAAVVTSLDCAGVTHNGNLTSGVAASGVSSVISYTGGNGGTYATQTVNSTGVITGLTATLIAGTLASGAGTLTYTITGTPSTSGTAWFSIGFPGNTAACNFSISVRLPAATVTTLTCPTQISGTTITPGTAVVSGNTFFQVSYTGGNGGSFAAQTITSTGVTGLTATLAANSVNNASGTLNYFITGTATENGVANFEIAFGGQTCTYSCPVSIIPLGAVFEQSRTFMITSAFDQDYLPYTAPTVAATTNAQMADGINEATALNIQGSITTTGVEVLIPHLITSGGYTIPAYTTTITIPADRTEDGISRDLTFSWESQYVSQSNRGLIANIKAVGGTLNLKKLDINAGIGVDRLGVLVGQFTYPFSNNGAVTSILSIRSIPAVPDKMFGVTDNNNDTTSHTMFYGVVMGPDGNMWLNNNLGAHYANTNHTNFNPYQQAASATDHLAFGSLFQWGRSPDGHELITWTNSTTGTPVNGTTTTLSDTPTSALFITATSGSRDWRASTTVDATRWSTTTSTNNPCPVGFRVPTRDEFQVIQGTITNASQALSSTLKFVQTGRYRLTTGATQSTTDAVYLWTSQLLSGWPIVAYFANSASTTSNYFSIGYNVRCFRN